MKNKTFLFLVFFLTVVIILIGCGGGEIDESINLIKNGSFENIKAQLPVGWIKDAYQMSSRNIRFAAEAGNAYSGDNYIVIENRNDADSRFIQNIKVNPNTYYRITGWLKAENILPQKNKGANISVMGVFASSEDYNDTAGDWKYVELYGKTGKNQRQLQIGCRVGGYGEESRGKAYFDEIAVHTVKGYPSGKQVVNFFQEVEKRSEQESKPHVPLNVREARKKTNALFWIIFFSILFTGIYFFVYYYFLKKDILKIENNTKNIMITFFAFTLIALLLRLIIGYFIEGQAGDLSCFKGWGSHAITKPWPDYYDYYSAYTDKAKYWCDYPPVYIMILAFLAWIKNIFHLAYDSNMYTLLIKLPNILSDIICCFLIYKIARKKLNNTSALALSILYAFNPAIIINSAVWGQADAIYTLLALLIVMFILDDKMWLSAIILGIALLIKIQTAFVAFAFFFALVEKKSIKKWLTSIAAGIGSFILLVLPFGIKLPWEWIEVQLIGTLSGYPFASVNAYNTFALIGKNWTRSHEKFLGISFDMWGVVFAFIMIVFIILIYFWNKKESKNYYVSLFCMAGIFMFIPGMHERYLYATILFSIMTFIYTKDRRFLYLFLVYTITVFVNVYHILDVFIVVDLAKARYPDYPIEPFKNPVMFITSLANVVIFIYLVKVGIDVFIRNRLKLNTGVTYRTTLEVMEEAEAEEVSQKKTKKEPQKSKFGNLILLTGIAGTIIPFLGVLPWILGNRESKKYSKDLKVKTGRILGLGFVAFYILLLILGLILYPGLKNSGALS